DADDAPDRGCRDPLLELPHHRAVLAHALVPAHRTQRHEQQHGVHHRGGAGVPGLLGADPVRERHHRRSAERARLEHLRHRHVAPSEERGVSAWKARWPLGRASGRFYGFLGGETNQWYPDLVDDNHAIDPPARPEDGYHLSRDLVDKAIGFIRDSKSVAPDKPWFMYFCPGCAHAPHHVWKEWADRYKGRFDMGYEAIRAGILEKQKELGLLPEDTELSPINPHGEPDRKGPASQPWPELDFVRPWDSLSDDERRLFARMAEVYAGYVSYTDH